MPPSATSHPAAPALRRGRPLLAAALAFAGITCADSPLTGPGLAPGPAALRMQPRFEARASTPAFSVTSVRLAVSRLPDGIAVLDTVVALEGPDGTRLDLSVPVARSDSRFELRLAATDASGDTIFRAVDTATVSQHGLTTSVREVLLRYAGADTAFTRIEAGPRGATLAPGEELSLWAVGFRPGSPTAHPLAHVAWSSSDESAVQVSLTGGRATAVAAGREAWVYARTATELVDSMLVVVRPEPSTLAALEVTPGSLAVTVGETRTLAAAGRDAGGAAVTGHAVAWSSSAPAVATVAPDGTVTGVASGSATITAASGAVSATAAVLVQAAPVATVTVTPPAPTIAIGQSAHLEAHAATAAGDPVAGAATWTTSDPAVATVSGAGLVTGQGLGSATVTATVGGASASATVTVTAAPVDAVVVSPTAVTLAHGGSAALTALVTDGAGQPISGTPVTWRSGDAAVATVSPSGVVTAVGAGTTTVTATSAGRSTAATVTVRAVPVATVTLSAGTAALVAGESHTLVATPRAADGAALAGRAATWSTSAPAVATVSSGGVVTAVSPGTATITATVEGRSAAATVTVRSVPVATVTVEPSSASLQPGATYQLHERPRDADGNLLTGRGESWTSSDDAVATVAADGLVTAHAAGSAVISATVDGVKATATVTVMAAMTRSARVTPATATVAISQTLQLQAQAYVGTTPVGASFGWTSRATGVATVSASGKVTPVAPGSVWIVAAELAGGRDSARVTVTYATGKLQVAGWPSNGEFEKDREYRIRVYPRNADGSARASFGQAVTFRLDQEEKLEVHEDKNPTQATGKTSGSKKGRVYSGETLTAAAGDAYLSLIVVIRGEEKDGALTITETTGAYQAHAKLRGRTGEDDD